MQEQRRENELIQSVWSMFDPDNTGYIQPNSITPFLEALATKHGSGKLTWQQLWWVELKEDTVVLVG